MRVKSLQSVGWFLFACLHIFCESEDGPARGPHDESTGYGPSCGEAKAQMVLHDAAGLNCPQCRQRAFVRPMLWVWVRVERQGIAERECSKEENRAQGKGRCGDERECAMLLATFTDSPIWASAKRQLPSAYLPRRLANLPPLLSSRVRTPGAVKISSSSVLRCVTLLLLIEKQRRARAQRLHDRKKSCRLAGA